MRPEDKGYPRYDHRAHAGNAGDVWKHFILTEVAAYLLSSCNKLVYAESHGGYPDYSLDKPGEWLEGVGRLWPMVPKLRKFSYFQVLVDLNSRGLRLYPGSARLVLEVARRHGSDLRTEIWDIDPAVAASWQRFKVGFHLGDGFVGVLSFIEHSTPGLLLIDPPYLDDRDMELAMHLLGRAKKAGWVVLWWYMIGSEPFPEDCSLNTYSINFADKGLSCGRWRGAVVAQACSDKMLGKYVDGRSQELLKILSSSEPF